MKLCRTAFALVICLFVPMQGELQCSCSNGCGNDGTTFPGSNGEIVNVAYGKPANMSSRFQRDGESGPACVAVNGRTDTVFKTQADPDTNCVQTNDFDYDAFWLVDLGRNYTVTDITVYRNKVAPHRMSSMSVFVDNQLCYSFLNRTGTAANIASLNDLPERINITCPTPLTGRHVRFQKNGWDRNYGAGGYLINICEVQVWACKDGLYGVQCDQTCSGHCKDNDPCDNYYGTCPTECADGYYDQRCMSLCGNCSNSEVCDKVTGNCPTGCQPGFDPSDPLCKTPLTGLLPDHYVKYWKVTGEGEGATIIFRLHSTESQQAAICRASQRNINKPPFAAQA